MSPQGVTNEGAPMGEAPMRMEGGELIGVQRDSKERNKTDVEGLAKQQAAADSCPRHAARYIVPV